MTKMLVRRWESGCGSRGCGSCGRQSDCDGSLGRKSGYLAHNAQGNLFRGRSKFNKEITVGLILCELLNLVEYNVHMAKLLDGGRNKAATKFAISLIRMLLINDSRVISKLRSLVDALAKVPNCSTTSREDNNVQETVVSDPAAFRDHFSSSNFKPNFQLLQMHFTLSIPSKFLDSGLLCIFRVYVMMLIWVKTHYMLL